MQLTAYSQIIEQFIRVTFIITFAIFIFNGTFSVRDMATFGVFSSLISMFITVIFSAFLFRSIKPKLQIETFPSIVVEWTHLFKTIIVLGLVASLNHLTLIFIQMIDVLTLVPQLITLGLSPLDAMVEKGIYDRAIPLIQFGAVLGSSFALAFIPMLSTRKLIEQKLAVRNAYSLSLYIALGATIGLIVIYREVNLLLFKSDSGTTVLQLLAIAILLLSLSITGSAILQAYRYVRYTVVALVFALLIKLGLNYVLIPTLSIYGSAIATITALSCLTLCITYAIIYKIKLSPFQQVKWLPLSSSALVMVIYLTFIKFIVGSVQLPRLLLLCYVLFLVISGAVVYIVMLLRYDVIDKRHIHVLPFSGKLLSLKRFVSKGRQ